MLWRGVVAGAKSLGVPVYDENLPQSDEERQALYRSALERAEGEEYTEFEEANLMHVAGTDKRGNRLVVVTGANLPPWGALDKERFRRYVYSKLHAVATQEAYCIVYLHADMQASHRPCASWLMNSFEVLPDVWQERLHGFYVVHPAMTLRAALSILPFWLFSPFARGDFVQKVIYIDRIEQLWEDMDQAALRLPTHVAELDAELEEKGALLSRPPGCLAPRRLTMSRRAASPRPGVGYMYGIVPPPEELRAQHDAMMGGSAPNE
jgi:hypothetical protein